MYFIFVVYSNQESFINRTNNDLIIVVEHIQCVIDEENKKRYIVAIESHVLTEKTLRPYIPFAA